MVTLCDSHGTAGAAVDVSRLGSALAVAMMVSSSGTPPLAACLNPDWMLTECALRGGHRLTAALAEKDAAVDCVNMLLHAMSFKGQ